MKKTKNTDTVNASVEMEWFYTLNYSTPIKKCSPKELKEYREERKKFYSKRSEMIDKNYNKLCEILWKMKTPCRVETPYGEINFFPFK